MTGESTWMIIFLMALERQIQVDMGGSNKNFTNIAGPPVRAMGCHGI